LRNEMYIGSRSGSGTCFVAFRACAERRNFSHIEGRGNKVSKMAHETVSCSTVCLLSSRCATRGTTRTRCSQDPRGILGTLAEPTGTDGFRVLCHQFYTSSLLLQENCIKSSKTFSLRMKKPREALLQLYNIGGQDQEIRHMVYPLQNGRLSYNVCLRRKNLSEQLRMTMASLMKRYGVCMGYPHRN